MDTVLQSDADLAAVGNSGPQHRPDGLAVAVVEERAAHPAAAEPLRHLAGVPDRPGGVLVDRLDEDTDVVAEKAGGKQRRHLIRRPDGALQLDAGCHHGRCGVLGTLLPEGDGGEVGSDLPGSHELEAELGVPLATPQPGRHAGWHPHAGSPHGGERRRHDVGFQGLPTIGRSGVKVDGLGAGGGGSESRRGDFCRRDGRGGVLDLCPATVDGRLQEHPGCSGPADHPIGAGCPAGPPPGPASAWSTR